MQHPALGIAAVKGKREALWQKSPLSRRKAGGVFSAWTATAALVSGESFLNRNQW